MISNKNSFSITIVVVYVLMYNTIKILIQIYQVLKSAKNQFLGILIITIENNKNLIRKYGELVIVHSG